MFGFGRKDDVDDLPYFEYTERDLLPTNPPLAPPNKTSDWGGPETTASKQRSAAYKRYLRKRDEVELQMLREEIAELRKGAEGGKDAN